MNKNQKICSILIFLTISIFLVLFKSINFPLLVARDFGNSSDIFIFFVLLLTFLLKGFIFKVEENSRSDEIGTIIISVFISIILSGLIILLIIIIGCGYFNDNVDIIEESYPLYNFNDSSTLKGEINSIFFIADGYLDEVRYYSYYIKEKYGLKHQKMKYDNDSKIYIQYIDNPNNARLVKYYKTYPDNDIVSKEFLRYVFFIPKGSIKKDFIIDME